MGVVSSATYNNYSSSKATASAVAVPVVTPAATTQAQASLQSFSKTNPAFAGVSAQKVARTVTGGALGGNQRIVRGYIRRTDDGDRRDPTAGFRLNFMYNPETIQRQFISYLDQNALDPFNTVHGSGNITAPPGILDFSFELFFDRQLEVARDEKHPGIKVDYDYFDLVVRGVIPGAVINSVPDNGVMMVNPRNITVVFGPELQVTGKPYNASVSFDKFSHKMTATRCRILLQMKVLHIGPRPLSYTYRTERDQQTYAATVPYDNKVEVNVTYGGDVDSFNAKQGDFDGLGLDLGGWSTDGDSTDSGSGGGGGSQPAQGGGGSGSTTGGGGAAWNGPVDVERILARIRNKESGGNYTAQNAYSTASGAYQFTDPTWGRYGGYAKARLAPASVQDEKARANVNYFLNKYNNILESVPASWYVGNYRGHGNLNYMPPGRGNRETVQQYVDEWLAGY